MCVLRLAIDVFESWLAPTRGQPERPVRRHLHPRRHTSTPRRRARMSRRID